MRKHIIIIMILGSVLLSEQNLSAYKTFTTGKESPQLLNLHGGKMKILSFAQCPYEIQGVKAVGNKMVKKGDDYTVTITVLTQNVQTISNHTLNIKVYGPDNEYKSYLHQNLYLENGTGTFTLPIALNDRKGRWKIVVQEVISGKKAV